MSVETVWFKHDGVIRETDQAYLVDRGDGEEVWLPKSQVEDIDNEVCGIPSWLAAAKHIRGDW